MIRRTKSSADQVKVTFVVPAEVGAVSVVGDFNGWDPLAHPLRKRSNGTRSVAVELPVEAAFRFRYLADGGRFFDDESADGYEHNGYGETHCLVRT